MKFLHVPNKGERLVLTMGVFCYNQVSLKEFPWDNS